MTWAPTPLCLSAAARVLPRATTLPRTCIQTLFRAVHYHYSHYYLRWCTFYSGSYAKTHYTTFYVKPQVAHGTTILLLRFACRDTVLRKTGTVAHIGTGADGRNGVYGVTLPVVLCRARTLLTRGLSVTPPVKQRLLRETAFISVLCTRGAHAFFDASSRVCGTCVPAANAWCACKKVAGYRGPVCALRAVPVALSVSRLFCAGTAGQGLQTYLAVSGGWLLAVTLRAGWSLRVLFRAYLLLP